MRSWSALIPILFVTVAGAYALALPSPARSQSAAVSLRYKFKAGQVLEYKKSISTDTAGMPGASAGPMNMASSSLMILNVKKVDPQGNATIVVRMSSPSFGGSSAMMGSALKKLGNISYTEVVSPTGVIRSMRISNGPGAGTEIANPGQTGLGQAGDLTVFPDHPIRVGETWRNSASSGQFGMHSFTKMTLTALRQVQGHTIATISIVSDTDMSSHGRNSGFPMMGLITGGGTVVFNLDAGAMTSSSITMHTDMNLTVPKMPSTAGSTTHSSPIHMRMTVISSMRLIS